MKPFPLWSTEDLFVELGQSSLKVLNHEHGLDLPLDRQDNGRLTGPCKERLVSALRGFVGKSSWAWRQRAICGLSARGVSLRRMAVPKAADEELRRLLALQIEREFPLPPDALAWSYCPAPGQVSASSPEWLVVALKRDLLQEYNEVLVQAGLNPIFSLAAVGRAALCPRTDLACALLDIGRCHSELITVEQGRFTGMRILPWGGENVTQAIQAKLGISRDAAEKLKIEFGRGTRPPPDTERAVESCLQAEANTLADLLKRQSAAERLFVTGETARSDLLIQGLTQALGPGAHLVRLDIPSGAGRSAATLGWQTLSANHGAEIPLAFQSDHAPAGETLPKQTPAFLAALAGMLLLASLAIRYGEPLLRQPKLARDLARISSQRAGLPSLDREASFLEFMDTNQPPFLDTLAVVANAAPPGARLDSLAMTRRGDFSLRGSMANAEQAAEFRSKLVDSGYFTTVVLDEQSPTPDRQKVTFRLTVQLKPAGERPPLPAMPSPKDAKTAPVPATTPPPALAPPPATGSPPDQPPGSPRPRPVRLPQPTS